MFKYTFQIVFFFFFVIYRFFINKQDPHEWYTNLSPSSYIRQLVLLRQIIFRNNLHVTNDLGLLLRKIQNKFIEFSIKQKIK